jgi:hypothetical protein
LLLGGHIREYRRREGIAAKPGVFVAVAVKLNGLAPVAVLKVAAFDRDSAFSTANNRANDLKIAASEPGNVRLANFELDHFSDPFGRSFLMKPL